MAIFKIKDREKRTSKREYHKLAMSRVRDSLMYVDPELSQGQWEDGAWDDYVYYIAEYKDAEPVSREKFLRELRKWLS